MYRATYLFLFIPIIFFIAGTDNSDARQSLGVLWEAQENQQENNHQLNLFDELGVELLELKDPVDRELLNQISAFDFTILIRSSQTYYIQNEIREQQRLLIENYQEIASEYATDFNVTAIGLLTNSQVYNPQYLNAFSPILDSLEISSNKNFYFVHKDEWFYFHNPIESFAKLINGTNFHLSDLATLDQNLTASDENSIIFVDYNWLVQGIEAYPTLQSSLIDYKETGEWLLPLPHQEAHAPAANWPVLLLLVLWIGLAVQFVYVPVSAAMIPRFFFAHRFYADDIVHYRERSAVGGISMMAIHSVFGGLVLYLLAHTYISETGIQAFFDHLPALAITGRNYFSVFLLGILLIAVMQIISLFWLYLPNKTLRHFSQIINLYAGIFYIDFIVVTVMLTLYLAGASAMVILVFGAIYLLCWFSAFYIAAIDASKTMGIGKGIYLLLTMGLHTLLIAIVVLLLFYSTELLQVIELAIHL